MRKKTLGYILQWLIISSLAMCPMYTFAQIKKDKKKENTSMEIATATSSYKEHSIAV